MLFKKSQKNLLENILQQTEALLAQPVEIADTSNSNYLSTNRTYKKIVDNLKLLSSNDSKILHRNQTLEQSLTTLPAWECSVTNGDLYHFNILFQISPSLYTMLDYNNENNYPKFQNIIELNDFEEIFNSAVKSKKNAIPFSLEHLIIYADQQKR